MRDCVNTRRNNFHASRITRHVCGQFFKTAARVFPIRPGQFQNRVQTAARWPRRISDALPPQRRRCRAAAERLAERRARGCGTVSTFVQAHAEFSEWLVVFRETIICKCGSNAAHAFPPRCLCARACKRRHAVFFDRRNIGGTCIQIANGRFLAPLPGVTAVSSVIGITGQRPVSSPSQIVSCPSPLAEFDRAFINLSSPMSRSDKFSCRAENDDEQCRWRSDRACRNGRLS